MVACRPREHEQNKYTTLFQFYTQVTRDIKQWFEFF
jgi:hypothetical protein